MTNARTLKIVYFGGYDLLYTRVRTTLKGLKKNEVEIIECRSNHRFKLFRLIILAAKYLKIAKQINVLMVAEAGQAYVPLAKILSFFTKKPLLFDAYLSYFHVKTADEKNVSKSSLKGKCFYFLDKLSCKLADLVILDTQEHADYFSKTFNLPKEKFRIVPVGSDDEIFYKRKIAGNPNEFLILSVSSFYPLHGIEYIIKAAKILENYSDIKFLIIGDGPTRKRIEQLMKDSNSKNIEFRKGLISPFEFADLALKANICLGQFGATDQVQMVFPAKVYDFLALGKPIITGLSKSVSKILSDKKEIVFCPVADEKALAEAIIMLKKNPQLMEKIGENGYNLFKEKFSTQKIGEILKSIIKELVKNEK